MRARRILLCASLTTLAIAACTASPLNPQPLPPEATPSGDAGFSGADASQQNDPNAPADAGSTGMFGDAGSDADLPGVQDAGDDDAGDAGTDADI